MLISCPKCQSLYEIPDDLIGKTGKNFRCQTCLNVWHAMPEDSFDYETNHDEKPFIEPLDVKVPPHRHYPANKETYTVPADYKSGVKTPSSKELIAKEGDPDFTPPAPKKQKEITLTSSKGTSFTINAEPRLEKNEPRFFTTNEELTVSAADRLILEKPQKYYKKTKLLLLFTALLLAVLFLRREVVALYPNAEMWYNKIYLSGINNPENLTLENITIQKTMQNNTPVLNLKADIINKSFYATTVPDVVVNINAEDKTKKPLKGFLKSGEKTSLSMTLPTPKETNPISIKLKFKTN